eukprot:gnl/MRDRNA2_/MRDRNA2_78082_c0_seq2.p1 gnl/MRDRNA2_/MRDRNA2_78082_c0~~gnl/MRDRNA2_/MRDRNA2_78082_c0_seq2.p1  ORF type:complete len:223 (+),score=38.46 gnl/MRDRNA2_/MRDRNA2_78082_c0_seq2:115-783(+)
MMRSLLRLSVVSKDTIILPGHAAGAEAFSTIEKQIRSNQMMYYGLQFGRQRGEVPRPLPPCCGGDLGLLGPREWRAGQRVQVRKASKDAALHYAVVSGWSADDGYQCNMLCSEAAHKEYFAAEELEASGGGLKGDQPKTPKVLVFREGQQVCITTRDGDKSILSAWYGDPFNAGRRHDVTTKVQELVDESHRLSLVVGNRLFGEPAFLTPKRLSVVFIPADS